MGDLVKVNDLPQLSFPHLQSQSSHGGRQLDWTDLIWVW